MRKRISVRGTVQGVGFRPFVYRLAHSYGLRGYVCNNSAGVLIEAQGRAKMLEAFEKSLKLEAPALATVHALVAEECPEKADTGFRILFSQKGETAQTHIAVDSATCEECLQEMNDPQSRFYYYPFLNCTNCGPRFTIVKSVPYDRPFTSMAGFKMCPDCRRDYNDPLDRRFHAQPVACARCGPALSLVDNTGNEIAAEPLQGAVSMLKSGSVLAIKGIGGFHLAADAHHGEAIDVLRERKRRHRKPLAIMLPDITEAEKLCHLSVPEKEALLSSQRPIILARKRNNDAFSERLAAGQRTLGIMLPYAPLHHLLLKHFKALVMTSANLSDEPIAIDNNEALQRLGNIADAFLLHNRDILQRCDDSILFESAGKMRMLRRARGFIPAALLVENNVPVSMLAAGAEQKCCIAINKGNSIIPGQHVGDLDNPMALGFYKETISHLCDVFDVEPQRIIHDMHPGYFSTQWALEQGLPTLAVQHHHAHFAAVLAENNFEGDAIGLILDGTGYGTDGTIWGGEILVGNCAGFERAAWQETVAMPGGEAAVREPWRMMFSWLKDMDGATQLPEMQQIAETDKNVIRRAMEKNINCPVTSSCGRLFDAVSAMLGICRAPEYEAEAAILLEMSADESVTEKYDIVARLQGQVIPLRPLLKALLQDHLSGQDVARTAALFHNTLAEIYTAAVAEISQKTGLQTVVLSGGVFQNRLFFKRLLAGLEKHGLAVLTHSKVPCNDGGIAFGQMAVAYARYKSGLLKT